MRKASRHVLHTQLGRVGCKIKENHLCFKITFFKKEEEQRFGIWETEENDSENSYMKWITKWRMVRKGKIKVTKSHKKFYHDYLCKEAKRLAKGSTIKTSQQ